MSTEFEHSSLTKVWDKYSDQLLQTAHPGLNYLLLDLKARKSLVENNEAELLTIGISRCC